MPFVSFTMGKPTQFFSLPFEIREMIWTYAASTRIIEFGEPCEPDILPESDLRKAWLLNRRVATIAHVCQESRSIAMRECRIRGQEPFDPDYLADDRCWLKTTEIIHFNAFDYPKLTEHERFELEDHLIGCYKATELGKMISFSADIIHPFIRFHRLFSTESLVFWNSFLKHKECIISLHTVCIRATKEQTRALGLFGCGEEPAQLIDPFDKQAIQRFKELWILTQDEDVAATKFFDTIDTNRFKFRVERWLAQIEAQYISWEWTKPPFPTPNKQQIVQLLQSRPTYRHDPEVSLYLTEFPKLHLRIMFRLCPPDVDKVIT